MKMLLLAATLVATPFAALAVQNETAPGPAPAPAAVEPPISSLTPAQLVDRRQSMMGRSGRALGAMRQAAADADLAAFTPQIAWLSDWGHHMVDYFPANSNVAGTEAKPEVWSDRAGFQAAATRFQTAVDALSAPAAAGDHAAFAAHVAEVRATCSGCHSVYKD